MLQIKSLQFLEQNKCIVYSLDIKIGGEKIKKELKIIVILNLDYIIFQLKILKS